MNDTCRISLLSLMLVVCIDSLYSEDLTAVHQSTKGEIIATQLTVFSAAYWRPVARSLDAPVVAVFDSDHILMTVYGVRNTAEDAKVSIMAYEEAIEEDFIPHMEKYFGVVLSLSDFKIVYRNRTAKTIPAVLIWEKGEYKIP